MHIRLYALNIGLRSTESFSWKTEHLHSEIIVSKHWIGVCKFDVNGFEQLDYVPWLSLLFKDTVQLVLIGCGKRQTLALEVTYLEVLLPDWMRLLIETKQFVFIGCDQSYTLGLGVLNFEVLLPEWIWLLMATMPYVLTRPLNGTVAVLA